MIARTEFIGGPHPNKETLAGLLKRPSDDDSDAMLRHVEACETCQAQLETLLADGVSWQEAGRMLREDDFDVAQPFGHQDPLQCGSVTFLDPSDRPESLGRFGRYEIVEILGRGGMGIVMRGFDPDLNRYSAIKVLAPELASSAAARKRFSREAKSAAAVVHPHVVPIQTVDHHEGLPYLVMPVVEGQSLQQRVELDGPLSIIETVRIAAQVAEGLAAAHQQGLVHRDIKPANVLLENGVERVQITDFGLARAIDDASMTRSGVIAGTPQYMSPEQAHGDAIDHRSDLFSLGSLIYFMLTGRSPFRAETTMGVLHRITGDQPRSLRSINADVPQWLDAIVVKLLSKSADGRYQDASEVAELLQSWHAHLQQPHVVAAPQKLAKGHDPSGAIKPDGVCRSANRRPPRSWLIGLAMLGFVAFATVIVLETDKGTIRIETDSDVPVRISRSGGTVREMTVSTEGKSIRVKSGRYQIVIEADEGDYEVSRDEFVLRRGESEVVRITQSVDQESDLLKPRDSETLTEAERQAKEVATGYYQHLYHGRFAESKHLLAANKPDRLVNRNWFDEAGTLLQSLDGLAPHSPQIAVAGNSALAVFHAFEFQPANPDLGEAGRWIIQMNQVGGAWQVHDVDIWADDAAKERLQEKRLSQARLRPSISDPKSTPSLSADNPPSKTLGSGHDQKLNDRDPMLDATAKAKPQGQDDSVDHDNWIPSRPIGRIIKLDQGHVVISSGNDIDLRTGTRIFKWPFAGSVAEIVKTENNRLGAKILVNDPQTPFKVGDPVYSISYGTYFDNGSLPVAHGTGKYRDLQLGSKTPYLEMNIAGPKDYSVYLFLTTAATPPSSGSTSNSFFDTGRSLPIGLQITSPSQQTIVLQHDQPTQESRPVFVQITVPDLPSRRLDTVGNDRPTIELSEAELERVMKGEQLWKLCCLSRKPNWVSDQLKVVDMTETVRTAMDSALENLGCFGPPILKGGAYPPPQLDELDQALLRPSADAGPFDPERVARLLLAKQGLRDDLLAVVRVSRDAFLSTTSERVISVYVPVLIASADDKQIELGRKLRVGQIVYSKPTGEGSVAEVIRVSDQSSTARVTEIDRTAPFNWGEQAFAAEKRTLSPLHESPDSDEKSRRSSPDAKQIEARRIDFKRIGLALHNYRETHGRFPSIRNYRTGDTDKKYPYSWRVAILPFLETGDNTAKELYDAYHFDEPYDGPNNRKLISMIPECFKSTSANLGEGLTNVLGVATGDEPLGSLFVRLPEGDAMPVIVTESSEHHVWTKPNDSDGHPANAKTFNTPQRLCILIDGSVRLRKPEPIDPAESPNLSETIEMPNGNHPVFSFTDRAKRAGHSASMFATQQNQEVTAWMLFRALLLDTNGDEATEHLRRVMGDRLDREFAQTGLHEMKVADAPPKQAKMNAEYRRTFKVATNLARVSGAKQIGTEHLIAALLQESEEVQDNLTANAIDPSSLLFDILTQHVRQQQATQPTVEDDRPAAQTPQQLIQNLASAIKTDDLHQRTRCFSDRLIDQMVLDGLELLLQTFADDSDSLRDEVRRQLRPILESGGVDAAQITQLEQFLEQNAAQSKADDDPAGLMAKFIAASIDQPHAFVAGLLNLLDSGGEEVEIDFPTWLFVDGDKASAVTADGGTAYLLKRVDDRWFIDDRWSDRSPLGIDSLLKSWPVTLPRVKGDTGEKIEGLSPETEASRNVHDGPGDSSRHRLLSDAVAVFNKQMKREHEDFDQPPLTVDEVVAFASWKATIDDSAEFSNGLRSIASHKRLPDGWQIRGSFGSEPYYEDGKGAGGIRVYDINLLCPTGDGGNIVLLVRRRCLQPPAKFLNPVLQAVAVEGSISLDQAIDDFNRVNHSGDQANPSLTKEEVLAAIVAWQRRDWEDDIDKWTFANFQDIAQTHRLPDGAKIEALTDFEIDGVRYSIWLPRIVMPQSTREGWTYAFQIRRQFVSHTEEFAKPNEQDQSRSLQSILQQYNEDTQEDRQEKFDPSIPDLTLEQLVAAFRAGAENYRKSGDHKIAKALDASADAQRLAGGLSFHELVTGTQATSEKTEELSFKQYLPTLFYKVASNSSKLVVLSEAELRWSRHGWSSPNWGDIHPPVAGDWELYEVEQDGKTLDEQLFRAFREERPWSEVMIEAETLTLNTTYPRQVYAMEIHYDGMLPNYALHLVGSKQYEGVFMTNGFITNDELKLAINFDGKTVPETFHTAETGTTLLKYRRKGS